MTNKNLFEQCKLKGEKCELRTLWHGTTIKRADNIKKEGFKPMTQLKGEGFGEGWSSVQYEGGLYFFGKDTPAGKEIAVQHAEDEAKRRNGKAAVIKATVCICNELTDDMVNEEYNDWLGKKAMKETKEEINMFTTKDGRKFNIGHRFTYSKNWGSRAFNSLSTGVMTSYKINISDIMKWLKYDAIDGFEDDLPYGRKYGKTRSVTTVLNEPESVMDMKVLTPDKIYNREGVFYDKETNKSFIKIINPK